MPEDGAVHVNIFAAGQLGMKACSHFKQGTDTSAHRDCPIGGFGDTREDLEQCAFARAIASDNAKHPAFFKIEGDILQRPDEVLVVTPRVPICRSAPLRSAQARRPYP